MNFRRLLAMAGLCLCLAGRASAQEAPPTTAKQEIEQVLADQAKAWNSGDIDRFMDGYARTPDLRFATGGTVTRGWQQTLDRYKQRYPDRAAMGVLTFSELDTAVFSPTPPWCSATGGSRRSKESPAGFSHCSSAGRTRAGASWRTIPRRLRPSIEPAEKSRFSTGCRHCQTPAHEQDSCYRLGRNVHEHKHQAVRDIYPDGMHECIAYGLRESGEFEARTATLQQPEHGLSKEVLAATDVLTWWGHAAHAEVFDETVFSAARSASAASKLQGRLEILHANRQGAIVTRRLGAGLMTVQRETMRAGQKRDTHEAILPFDPVQLDGLHRLIVNEYLQAVTRHKGAHVRPDHQGALASCGHINVRRGRHPAEGTRR